MGRRQGDTWSKVILAVGALALVGCSATRPNRPGDLCAIFSEKPEWYEASREAYQDWGVPVPLQLAVIHHESGFHSDARPPRTKFLWIFPGPRVSSAFGYGQVLDGTWDTYQSSTGEHFADRDEFEDVVDFIGWYGHVGERRFGIPRADPYSFYLSYHEGHGGFSRGTHRGKSDVTRVAKGVAAQTRRYASQYQNCREALDDSIDGPWWWPF